MGLKDLEIKRSYISCGDENIATSFLVPALKQSILYQRSVGFFSSSVLEPILDGLGDEDSGEQMFTFLLRDCLCPIPDAMDVCFKIAGVDLCLHTTETKDRLRNGTLLMLVPH